MRNAIGDQCKVKMSGSEKKVNKKTYDIFSIKCVTKKFLEVSRCSRTKQQQRNVQKKWLHVQSCFFANQTYFCFSPFSSLKSQTVQSRLEAAVKHDSIDTASELLGETLLVKACKEAD